MEQSFGTVFTIFKSRKLYYKHLVPNAPAEWKYLQCCEILEIETLGKKRIVSSLSFAVKFIVLPV